MIYVSRGRRILEVSKVSVKNNYHWTMKIILLDIFLLPLLPILIILSNKSKKIVYSDFTFLVLSIRNK